MIQSQIKLRLNSKQGAQLTDWLWILTGVHNWAVRKIEQDAKGGVYYTSMGFQNLLANHSKKICIPSSVTLSGIPRLQAVGRFNQTKIDSCHPVTQP